MDAIERVPVETRTRAPTGHTNAYVVGRDDAILVDPAARTDRLDAVLDARSPSRVLLTHTHPDHLGGVIEYAAAYDLTVLARAGYERRFERSVGIAPDGTVGDGDVLAVDGTRITATATPGHAPDHLALIHEASGDVLVGDLAIADGSVFVGGSDADMRSYLTALRRLLARSPDRLLPGHGPVIEDPESTLSRLIAHRIERERRIERAVLEGAITPAEIVERVYERDLTGVEDLARLAVVAHLEKLAIEGRVRWDGDAARPR